MGSACCTEKGPVERVVEEDYLPESGSWSFKDFQFTSEPQIRPHAGALRDQGEQMMYGGRDPTGEMRHLLKIEATGDWPEPATADQASKFLISIRTGETRLGGSVSSFALPDVNKGVLGTSPLYVASLPTADVDLCNDVLFFCLEEQVGFGVVLEATWSSRWLRLWTMRQREAAGAKKQILVLTQEDGSLDFPQSVAVAWLKQEGIAFRHLTVKSFLLQGRPLLQALKQGKEAQATRLLRGPLARRLLQQRGSRGEAASHLLSQQGKLGLLQLALEVGADVDLPNFSGGTPLHLASEEGHEEVVLQLLAAQADVDADDDGGASALWKASRRGHRGVLRHLLLARGDVEQAADDGTTPLWMASCNGHGAVMRQLLAAGADASCAMADSSTALHVASEKGHEAAVCLLLQAHADPGAKSSDGLTPLDAAQRHGGEAVVRLLLQAGQASRPWSMPWKRGQR